MPRVRSEREKEYDRERYQANREARIAHQKEYYIKHRAEILARTRANYDPENRPDSSDYDRARYQAHREEILPQVQVIRKGVPGDLSVEEWENVKKFFNHTCLRCGRREPDIELTIDHVIPTSVGGFNWAGNIQPLCRPCNASKNSSDTDYRTSCQTVGQLDSTPDPSYTHDNLNV